MNIYKITILVFALLFSGCETHDSTSDAGSQTDTSDLQSEMCTELGEAGCKSRTECQPIFAQPYDSTQKCLAAKIFATCARGNDAECNNQVEGVLEDPNGGYWFQSAVCSSTNWRVVEEGESSPCNVVIQAEPCARK